MTSDSVYGPSERVPNDFPGVEIDTVGAGDYVDKVDAKIRHIKETYRSIKSGLSWELPKSKGKDLLA